MMTLPFKRFSVLLIVLGFLCIAVFSDVTSLAAKYGVGETVFAMFLLDLLAFFAPFQVACYTVMRFRRWKQRGANVE